MTITSSNPEVQDLYKQVFSGHRDKRDLWGELQSTHLLQESQRSRLDKLLLHPDAQGLLRNTVGQSLQYFRPLWNSLIALTGRVLRVEMMEPVFRVFQTSQFQYSLRLYFRPPVHEPLVQAFLEEVAELALTGEAEVMRFLGVSDQFILVDLYKSPRRLPEYIVLAKTYLHRAVLKMNSVQEVVAFGELILGKCAEKVMAYFASGEKAELSELFFRFFNRFFQEALGRTEKDMEVLDQFTARIVQRCIIPLKSKTLGRQLLPHLLNLATGVTHQNLAQGELFLKLFPYDPLTSQRLLWHFIAQSPRIERPLLIDFFTAPSFRDFWKYYSTRHGEVLEFLVEKLLKLLGKEPVDRLPDSLAPLVLRLLLGTRLDVPFLRVRSDFSRWLETRTKSKKVPALFVRLYLFEFILLAGGKFTRRRDIRLQRWADIFHKRVDREFQEIPLLTRQKDREAAWKKIHRIAREELWKPLRAKFPSQPETLGKIQSLAEQFNLEDEAIEGLGFLEPRYFWPFADAVRDYFRDGKNRSRTLLDPSTGAEVFHHRYWCRLRFEQVQGLLVPLVFSLVGMVPVVKSVEGPGLAYTDGESIYLPHWEDDFPDYPTPDFSNRNLTMYAKLAIHEAGHLLAGSFELDFGLLVRQVEFPQMLKDIFNNFEDYRIEALVQEVTTHPQTREIIQAGNLFLLGQLTLDRLDHGEFFMFALRSQMEGIWTDLCGINSAWKDRWDGMSGLGLPWAPYTDFPSLADDFLRKLRYMDLDSVSSAFLYSFDLYQVVKNWPSVIISLHSSSGPSPGGSSGRFSYQRDAQSSFWDDPAHQGGGRAIRTLEELQEESQKPHPTTSAGQARVPDISNPVATELGVLTEPGKIHRGQDKQEAKGLQVKDPTKSVLTLSRRSRGITKVSKVLEQVVWDVPPDFPRLMTRYKHLEEVLARNLWAAMENRLAVTDEWSHLEGEVDPERLIEILSDRKNAWDQRFLMFQDESRKSLAVAIAFDCSGSTEMQIIARTKPGEELAKTLVPTTVLDVERQFTWILARALGLLTPMVDIYGFTSGHITTLFRPEPLEAMGSLKSKGSNKDGTVIRYVAEKLLRRKEELKYLFFISDGSPSDTDHPGASAMEDTLLALRECRKERLKVIYLNIDSSAATYFPEMRREVQFARHFSDPSQLLGVIPELMKRIVEDVV